MPPRGRRGKGSGFTGFEPEAYEQVWQAIQVLRGKIPQLNHFARAATGNQKVTVEITTDTPHTRGNKIFIRPPLGLGSRVEHKRSECGARDGSGKQVCGACQIREVIDFYLFHEIAHVVGKTQETATPASFRLAREYVERYHHVGCEHYETLHHNITDYSFGNLVDSLNLGNALNQYLADIVNVLEDARINELTFQSRPGQRKIFEINMERLMTEGSEVGIDKYMSWAEAPLSAQFMIGLQLVAAEYDFESSLHPQVIEALADPKLVELCRQAVTSATSIHDIFSLSMEVFERAQDLGYCVVEKCEPAPPSPPEPEPSDTPGQDESEPDSTGGDGDGREPPEGGSGDGDESAEEGGDQSGGDPGAATPDDASDASAAAAGARTPAGDATEDQTSGDAEDAAPEPGETAEGEAEPGPGGTDAGDQESDGHDQHPGSPDGEAEQGDPGAAGNEPGTADGDPEPSGEREGAGDRTVDSEGGLGDEGSGPASGEPDETVRPVDPAEGDDDGAGSPSVEGGQGGEQPSEDTSPDDGATDSSDDAGISGIGTEGARSASGRLGVPQEELARESGSEQVGEGSDNVQPDARGGHESLETDRGDERREIHDVPGVGDADERPEAEADEGDEDHDLEPDTSNPWDVENPDDMPAQDGGFGAPSGPVEPLSPPLPVAGTPEDAARAVSGFLMHGTNGEPGMLDEMAGGDLEEVLGIPERRKLPVVIEQLIILAMKQVGFFDAPSLNVAATEIATFPHVGIRWDPATAARALHVKMDKLHEHFAPPESLIGKCLLRGRRVFDDNKRTGRDRNRRSGHINTRVLGRRAPVGDDRLFQKRVIPKKRDYFLVLAGDASGSTKSYERSPKIKRSMHAQADLLTRLGVPWAGYMHSAFQSPLKPFSPSGGANEFYNYMLPFKAENGAWNDEAKLRLASIMPIAWNLDGHSLEYYRKIAMKSTATDRIVVYYTDGQMPVANYDEEKVLLDREISNYKKHDIHLVCVGIQTDSPGELGLPYVRVDSDEDIIKVLEFLENILTR